MACHSNEAEKDFCEIDMAVGMQMCEVVELMTTSSECLIREQRCGNVSWHRCHYSGNKTKTDFTHAYCSMNTNGRKVSYFAETFLEIFVSE
jgi:hypothetical protein